MKCTINPMGYNQCQNLAEYVSLYNADDVQCQHHYERLFGEDVLDYVKIVRPLKKCLIENCIAVGAWKNGESYLCSVHLNEHPQKIRKQYKRIIFE